MGPIDTSDSSRDSEEDALQAGETVSRIFIGASASAKQVASNYVLKINNPGRSCVVEVIDKAAKSAVLRLDKAHRGTVYNYDHININPKISGLSKDPHIPLPPGGLAVGKATAKVCKVLNNILVPITIAIDAIAIGLSITKDIGNGTCRNTVETISDITGSLCGATGGAILGSTLGTAILPGIGTLVGGIICSLSGGVYGAKGAQLVTGTIGDAVEFGIIVKRCKGCNREFNARKYKGEGDLEYCEECDKSCMRSGGMEYAAAKNCEKL